MAFSNWRSKLILDNWAHFSFKKEFGQLRAPEGAWLAPMWVGDERRRLSAYTMLRSYRANVARWYLSVSSEEDLVDRDERHEYGDADLIVQSISSALLGDQVNIGAIDDQDAPEEYIEWAQKWAKKVRAVRKLTSVEDHAICEGDGVFVVGWDSKAGRPSLHVYDPGFYFPVLGDHNEEYPETVHIAWSIKPDKKSQEREKVRRITYRLVPTSDPRVTGPLDPDGLVSDDVNQGDYPWNNEPSGVTCLMSDGVWDMNDGPDIMELTEQGATWETNADGVPIHNLDLGIDFIPVVHIPNTPADEEHFGVSSLATVLQLLDELSNVYTDLSKGAAIAGFPPLASEGGALATGKDGVVASYGPGTVFNGKLTSIDTSSGLDVLMAYALWLLKLLSTNSRVPEVLLGRVDPGNVPSGVALRLMFSQMKMMIGRMHLVREEKYPLIFKFAARFAMANGRLTATTEWPEISFIPGQFIPADLEGTIAAITAAYTAKIISLETAIMMLIEAGLPIESLEDEIAAIQSRAFDQANALGLALDDVGAAAEFLGRPKPNLPDQPPEDDPVE